ncbi:hypothetical protein V3C99_004150 [Haemonchus contortus]
MSSWLQLLLLLSTLACICDARCRYRESRVRELAIRLPRNCRGPKPSVVGEEYWSSVGYNGALRDGRTTNDFLTLPQSGDGDIRSGWVAYWITKTKYGEGQHYEVFGHAFMRSDGRICALFAGRNRDMVELCGGFRVLSRNKNNPNEEMPFEWIQAGYAHPREALGFHHHRIAKYEWTPEDVFYGDAQLRGSIFRGVSPNSRFFMEMTTPDTFARKVWVLRRKPEVIAAMEAQAGYPPTYDRRYPESYRRTISRDEDESARTDPRYPQVPSVPIGGGVQPEWPPAAHDERRGEAPSGEAHPAWSAEADRSRGQPPHASRESQEHAAAGAEPSSPYSSQEAPGGRWAEAPYQPDARAHPSPPSHPKDQVRFRYVKPAAVVKDQYGRLYEGHQEGGETHYYPDQLAGAETARTDSRESQQPAAPASQEIADRGQHVAPEHHPHHVVPQHPASRERWEQDRSRQMDADQEYELREAAQRRAEYERQKAEYERQHAEHERQRALEYSRQLALERSRQEHPDYQQQQHRDAEQRRADYVRQNAFDYSNQVAPGRSSQSNQVAPERSPEDEEYESRRRAHHEQYLRLLEERRLEASRRRAEEERRRAELLAEQERRRYELERSTTAWPTSQTVVRDEVVRDEELQEISVEEDMNGSVEVSQYPARLPSPRALLKEETEEFDI